MQPDWSPTQILWDTNAEFAFCSCTTSQNNAAMTHHLHPAKCCQAWYLWKRTKRWWHDETILWAKLGSMGSSRCWWRIHLMLLMHCQALRGHIEERPPRAQRRQLSRLLIYNKPIKMQQDSDMGAKESTEMHQYDTCSIIHLIVGRWYHPSFHTIKHRFQKNSARLPWHQLSLTFIFTCVIHSVNATQSGGRIRENAHQRMALLLEWIQKH